jgi:hypothetical protein
MSDQLVATAAVETDAAPRYAKQLASHLGRKAEVVEEEAGTRLVLPFGDCLLVPGDAVLVMTASASDQETLDRVTQVVGSHLERFGQRNELVVAWQRQS